MTFYLLYHQRTSRGTGFDLVSICPRKQTQSYYSNLRQVFHNCIGIRISLVSGSATDTTLLSFLWE